MLLAAGMAALVATVLVTGLATYNQQAIEAGQRSVVQVAPSEERSVLVNGSGGRSPADFAARDTAIRDRFAGGLGGLPATVTLARYGTGRELTGNLGGGTPNTGEPVFASMVSLADLPEHAELVAGDWPTPGGQLISVTLPERVAALLEVTVGGRIPLTDRASKQASEVVVAGIWRPRDTRDPYWRLAPEVASLGAAYGPLVLNEADFARTFTGTISAAWLVEPELATADAAAITAAARAAAEIATKLPDEAGLGSSGQVLTNIDRLGDRLTRADMVGRSALLTPLLLIVVLGGYALVLVAALLNEDRRAQNALMRARGAARGQLAGLAAREAALVVLPGALLAPVLSGQALRLADGSDFLSGLELDPRITLLAWAVAGAAAGGCLVTMLGPALRQGATYIADLAARSRPDRSATVQRASVDIVLVGLAVLAWTQLRQYSSPLVGAGDGLGIDPLLATAPILGVLAGAVIALRLLPPATRFAERFVDRRPWTATMFGMWQAGRRPHAGPVLLLALAVGGSTLAFSLSATWERSLTDQADHRVGADLRLVERDGTAPDGRAAQLATLPGVSRALPAWKDSVRIGPQDTSATVLALDAAAAGGTVRLSEQLVADSPQAVFDRLAQARINGGGLELPPDARQLTGSVSTPTVDLGRPQRVTTTAYFATADGSVRRVPLPTTGTDGKPARFAIDLPDAGGQRLRFVGIEVDAGAAAAPSYEVQLTDLRLSRTGGTSEPVDLGAGKWSMVDGKEINSPLPGGTTDSLRALYPVPQNGGGLSLYGNRLVTFARFMIVVDPADAPVPAVVTPDALDKMSAKIGDTVKLPLSGATLPIRIVGTADSLPGTDSATAAVLLDLPSAATRLLHDEMTIRPTSEWWLSTVDGQHDDAAAAAAKIPEVMVLDRLAEARLAEREPYWIGARAGLLTAALGAILLALVGLGVDVWATARRRMSELAVLNTLGASPRLLARSLITEQAFLAGVGVVVGSIVGAAVSATMAPLVILTPSAGRPMPEPAFQLPWLPVGGTGLGLLLVAMAFSGLVAVTIRQRVSAAQLRIGGER
ncbi:ABC transporter permease [Micromonospora sonneratiae]